MSTTILVLGATGNIGKYVVPLLAAKQNVTVRAATRDPKKIEQWKGFPNVTAVEVDFSKPDTVEKAIAGSDKIFLCVAGTVQDSKGEGIRVADLAKKHGVKHIVKLSAYNIENKGYILGSLHKEVEDHIKSLGIPLTSLRPTSFNSNFLAWSSGTIKSANALYDASGSKPLNRIDNRDIAAVAAGSLLNGGHEGKVYDVTGPDNITQEEVAKLFSKVLGKEVKYVDVGEAGLRDHVGKMGLPPPAIDAMWDLFKFFREGGYSVAYNGVVEQVGGSKPHNLESFIRENAAAFQ